MHRFARKRQQFASVVTKSAPFPAAGDRRRKAARRLDMTGTFAQRKRYESMPPFMQQQPGQTRDRTAAPGTILVVEDEVLIRLMITEYLREFGYTVLEARNGDEAAKLLDGEGSIDVVFSDVRMPGRIDGLALAKWIARNRPEIGVLLTSAYVAPADLADSGSAVSGLLRKPYTPGEVLSRIRDLTSAAA